MKAWQKMAIAVCLLGTALSCRNDPAPAKPKIEKITFEEPAKTIYVGDTVKVNVAAEPKSAKESGKIEYSVTEDGVIEIKADSGNDGVVFEGIKRGATVITAKADGAVDYCSVMVLGAAESVIPHIIVPSYVMECRENERRSIVASLAGGTPLDDSGFVWSYSSQNVISLESTGNVGVFDTLNTGSSVVTISHPKAQFSVDVLVYVIGNDEIPIYITTDNNVMNLKTTDSNYEYAVELRGGDSGDYHNFTHELLDGGDVIELRVNNNIGTINPKAKGIARIGISHPKAAYGLEIVVIVHEEVDYRYIDVDKTLIIMEEGYNELVRAEMVGDAPLNHLEKYAFENENDDVIRVEQSNNQFSINSLKRGSSVLKIKNEYADFDREVLVIVNGIGSIQDNEVYISTNQNVITTEAGGDDVLLTMTLVGEGINSADPNSFVWTVDDGGIITVTSGHGTVRYINRAAVSNIGERFEAQAVIKANKVGTAKITLEHPKAKNDFSVMVKVYKKGVFDVVPVVVDGPGVYKVGLGRQVPAYLRVVTGNERNYTNVTWKSGNDDIVSVSGTGLTGMLEGKKNGITTITASGDNEKHPYQATVIVGDDEYLQTMPYMYVLNPFMSVIKGESVSFKIICEKMYAEEKAGITAVNNSGDIMEVFAYKDSVTVTGLALGEGEIIISGEGLNTVRVVVTVEDYTINPDMPYYLRADKPIYGLSKERNLEIGVDLVGGSAVNERNIIWKIEDSNVAVIEGNGRRCVITGRNAGQTVITASHPKSHNELEIVIYVVEKETEINGKVVLYAKEKNILMESGETRYISIITNASGAQQNSFQWSYTNSNVIDVRVSDDRVKAYIDAAGIGSAVITVRSGSQAVVIYVSVISRAYGGAYINVPSIVEMAAGETLSINAVAKNIDAYEITWTVKNADIAAVYGNGGTCMVNALRGGSTVITAEHKRGGFIKDIILYVYNSVEEMAGRYIIAGEQSRYAINKGDIVGINLVFGMKGYPEHELHNIRWRTSDNTVIEVAGNGKTANVKGLNAGIGIITVESGIADTVEIEVEVREIGKAGQYWFSIREQDRIKGILAGSGADITVEVFNGGNKVYNVSGIEYIVENNDIISVTANGGGIHVKAAAGKEGQSYITVRHDSAEDARILIYTALSDYGLQNAYPVLADKTNYLIKKGENVTITIRTKDNDSAKLNNISYGLERNNGVINVQERNKKEIAVNALNAGSDVILVRYNAQVVQRVYVSVTEGNYGPNAGYIVTENIIGLLRGEEYETKIETDAGYISWKNQPDYVINIISSSNKSAVIKGNLPGRTILTVSSGDSERSIAVFVCETEEELRQYQAINIEQRRYRIRKNENITINIHSYQGKVEEGTRYGDYYHYDIPYGNVIAVNAVENNKFSVKGINEGAAAIRVTNEYYQTEIVVYIEVAAAGEGDTGNVDRRHYITAGKTLYVIGGEERNVGVSVDVSGGDFYGDEYWVWSDYDSGIISVNDSGRGAVVNPVNEGRTKIRVSNKDCANTLDITVIVEERFVIDGSLLPYIYVEKNLYEVTKGAESVSIPYSLVNVNLVNIVRYTLYGNAVSLSHDAANRVFTAAVQETGIARFEITYGSLSREVYVLVKENVDAGNIYLTTSENYVAASIGELRAVNIDLAGYDEINSNNFTWSVEPKNGVVTLVGNGTNGQIYGTGEGSAVITVRHPKAEPHPLKINVKVVKDKVKESVIYLTTQRNVIETVAGTSSEQIYIQKVGGDVLKSNTTWTVSDSSIVSISGQGYTAQFTPKKEGVARIQAKNIESDYVLEIVVVVRTALNNNIYIDTGDRLLWLSPGELQRRISVILVNGETKDNNRFKWSIDHQQPGDVDVAKAGGKVINIVGSNEECFINTVNEGVARIRVENEKAELPLYITVYVSHYREMQFSVGKKEIVIGENEFVGINLPTYEYLSDKARVWVEKINGDSGSDICEVYYTNELVLLSGKQKGAVIVKAEIVGKEGQAQLYVTVAESADPNVNRVVVDKTMYILNPKSNPVTINASISGSNVFDIDNDNIQWEVKKAGIIDIMPKNGTNGAKGRQVQITPVKTGTATILVKHGMVSEEYWKEISIVIADTNNVLSVSRSNIELNSLRPETVIADIINGTAKDYAELKWVARMQQKWDGTMLEVVRIMGSGKEVTLYPMNDGETEVLVFYGKEVLTIKVKIVSDYYFSFRNGNEYMYPGETRDLPFDVKPANTNISWVSGGMPNEAPVITYSEVLGSPTGGTGNAVRYLQVRALREGSQPIVGMANGKAGQVNIIVQYDYTFNADGHIISHPKYDGIVGGVKVDKDGIAYANYTVYPPTTYINVEGSIPAGLEIEIEPVVDTPSTITNKPIVGTGRIKFTGRREVNDTVKFRLYMEKKADSDVEKPVVKEDGSYIEQNITVNYKFDKEIKPEPYFIRGEGKHSNTTAVNGTTQMAAHTLLYGTGTQGESINKVSDNTYSMRLRDGEVHYLLFDKQYETAYLDILGLGNSNNPSKEQLLRDVKDKNITFKATLEDITIDNITRKAVRLESDDYIEYNRVAFNQKLYMYVDSTTYKPESGTRNSNNTIPLYIDALNFDYDVTVTQESEPLWKPGSYYDENIKKTFVLIKNSYTGAMPNLGDYRKLIKNEPMLVDYHNDNRYTYYIAGSDMNSIISLNVVSSQGGGISAAYTNFMANGAETKELYLQLYCYAYSVYSANRTFFNAADTYVNVSGTLTKRAPITDQDVFSPLRLIGSPGTSTNSVGTYVYVYDKEQMKKYAQTGARDIEQGKSLAEILCNNAEDMDANDFTAWDQGFYEDAFREFLPDEYGKKDADYNKYLFSTVNIKVEANGIIDYPARQTVYDVFNQSWNNTDGVSITVPSYRYNGSYSYGALSSIETFKVCENSSQGFAEYLTYQNIEERPHLGNTANTINGVTGVKNRAIINGIEKDEGGSEDYNVHESFSRAVDKINPGKTITIPGGGTVNTTTVTYKAIPSYEFTGSIYKTKIHGNRMGPNIFALESDGSTKYGTYGPYYYCSDHSGDHKKKVFGLNWGASNNCSSRGHYSDYFSYYSTSNARQMLKWEGSQRVVVPYDIFNRFPFRYEERKAGGKVVTETKQIVKLSGGNGKPMPSIDKNTEVQSSNSYVNLMIHYKTSSGGTSYITIRITPEVRKSHMMYTGSQTSDGYINVNPDADASKESEGPITSFSDLPDAQKEKFKKYLE